jgi:tetratricopeptide (TPR) repeat protein
VKIGSWQFDPEALLELRLSRIQEALEQRKLGRALGEVEELLDEHPDHQLGLFLAGQAALGLGDAMGSMAAFRRCAGNAPQDPTIQLGLAMAAFESAAYTTALEAARLSSDLAPTLAQGWYYQGLVLERIEHEELARECFQRAHTLNPTEAPLPLDLSDSDWNEALKEALRCLPSPFQALYVQVPLCWAAFPTLEHLIADFPPLSPMSGALYVGKLPGEDADPWQKLPTEVRLYRGNLRHPTPLGSSLVERITAALLHEAMSWTGAAAEDILPD